MTVIDCMMKWKNLRDHFVREIKRRKKSQVVDRVHLMNLGGLILRQ